MSKRESRVDAPLDVLTDIGYGKSQRTRTVMANFIGEAGNIERIDLLLVRSAILFLPFWWATISVASRYVSILLALIRAPTKRIPFAAQARLPAMPKKRIVPKGIALQTPISILV